MGAMGRCQVCCQALQTTDNHQEVVFQILFAILYA